MLKDLTSILYKKIVFCIGLKPSMKMYTDSSIEELLTLIKISKIPRYSLLYYKPMQGILKNLMMLRRNALLPKILNTMLKNLYLPWEKLDYRHILKKKILSKHPREKCYYSVYNLYMLYHTIYQKVNLLYSNASWEKKLLKILNSQTPLKNLSHTGSNLKPPLNLLLKPLILLLLNLLKQKK